jgi:hypothetical protein
VEGYIVRYAIGLSFILTFLAVAPLAVAVDPVTAQSPSRNDNQWRYTFYNGMWWYWLPERRWVYWRDNHWNDYRPAVVVDSSAPAIGSYVTPGSGNRGVATSDIRPFYGHALSPIDRRPMATDNEIGPFYGHVLPGEVFGPWGGRRSEIRPFYGHAAPYGN